METLSIRAAVRHGWETFKKRPWFLVGIAAIFIVLNVVFPTPGNDAAVITHVSLGILSFLIGCMLQLAVTSVALKAHDHVEEASLNDLWRPELFLKFLLAMLLSGVILGIAFLIPIAITFGLYFLIGWASLVALLLLIPGIILAVSLSLVSYIVVDKQLGAVAAVKESLRLSKGNRGKLVLLFIVLGLIAILGVICLVVGLLVAFPVIAIAMAHAYRVLDAEKSSIVVA